MTTIRGLVTGQDTPFLPVDLRFEHYLPQPGTLSTLGISESRPRISWRLTDNPSNTLPTGYRLELVRGGDPSTTAPVYSEEIHCRDSTLLPWPEKHALSSREGAFVRVKVTWTWREESESEWSEWHYVETGLLSRSDWTCSRVSNPPYASHEAPSPSALFYKSFNLKGGVNKARVYITAQGVYDLRINGKPVSTDFMNPGWTNYHHRLLYQVYDVAGLLIEDSENYATVELAEGWFTGRLGWGKGVSKFYGNRNALMAQLEIEYGDGTRDVVNSDESWNVAKGASTIAEIYDGQTFDARRAKVIDESLRGDLALAGFSPVEVLDPLPESTELQAMTSAPMRQIDVVSPEKQFTTPSGKTILDFGQNLVGYARVKKVAGPEGHTVTFKFAEVMEKEELGTRPLRAAKATDHLILAGTEEPVSWEPNFTFHGFRYMQVDNWPESYNILDSIEAVVTHTDMALTSSFDSSNANLNKLHDSILWSMKGNFTGLPTDCPARDERMGWTGDIAVFAPTATFLYDCTALLKSWLKDLWLDQRDCGGMPPVVSPNVLQQADFWQFTKECAIWNDAVVLVPWALYMETGDPRVLEDQFESMETYLRSLKKGDEYDALWGDDTFQVGDWLDPLAPPENPMQAQTDPHSVANAFLINSLSIMAKVCAALGKPAEEEKYKEWHGKARTQFQHRYVTPAGLVASDSQTAYALAIVFDLLEGEQLRAAGARLERLVRKNNFRISTGFAGTPYVLEALARTEHVQVAYRMLLEEGCPSWLYPITMGATTTWERWDSMRPDGSVNPGEMTSFNHYAYGSVGQFIHERVGGLKCLDPGWARCRAAPMPGGEITRASVEHVAIHGRIGLEWEVVGETVRVKAWVPAGTVMELLMPGGRRIDVRRGVWTFEEAYGGYEWPPERITGFPNGLSLDENNPAQEYA